MRRARKMAERLKIVKDDPWLEPVEGELEYRRKLYLDALKEIEEASESIADYADGYLYFGFQRDEEAHGWWFREWLPGAWEVFLFGDFNGWERRSLPLARGADGVWSIFLYDGDWGRGLKHGSLYKILVHGENGWHERIPAYARRVVQDDATKNFTAQFWNPEPFDWTGDCFDIGNLPTLYIYESHVGMAVEQERVGSYAEFARDVLPRIKRAGYNTVQLMGVAEHPYYGSFGYHVSSFFAPSSRFGTQGSHPKRPCARPGRGHGFGTCALRQESERGAERARRYRLPILAVRRGGISTLLGLQAVRLRQAAGQAFFAVEHQILAGRISFRRFPF